MNETVNMKSFGNVFIIEIDVYLYLAYCHQLKRTVRKIQRTLLHKKMGNTFSHFYNVFYIVHILCGTTHSGNSANTQIVLT